MASERNQKGAQPMYLNTAPKKIFLAKQEKKLHPALFSMLFAFCLFTTLMQGIPVLAATPGKVLTGGCLFLFFSTFAALLFLHSSRRLTEERVVFFLIFWGMLFHCLYVLLSGLYDRQHDEGVYTGIATGQVNPGHIGYTEYIYKFHRLPDFNPYRLFSYYHPPLHYVLSGLWLMLLTGLGMPEDLAFENLQVLPLFYSGLFMLLSYHILKRTGAKGKGLYAGLLLTASHPALTILSGSVNNDMLSTVLLACAILATLRWMQDKSLPNLLSIAFSIGFGMLGKINTVVIALPVGLMFLSDFAETVRAGNSRNIIRSLRRYLLFGIAAGSTGLCWIVRNLIRFHEKPGISSATPDSVMYTGHYGIWERIGLPALSDWHFSFPFHALSGDTNHNTWVIMFQTSLFTEEYPAALAGLPLFLCQAAYVLAVFSAVSSALLFSAAQYRKWKNGAKPEAVFLSAGYFSFLLSFALFTIKYPYTCSSDFRYIAICLVYIAIGLSDSARLYPGRSFPGTCSRIIRTGVCATVILMTIVYLIWGQW